MKCVFMFHKILKIIWKWLFNLNLIVADYSENKIKCMAAICSEIGDAITDLTYTIHDAIVKCKNVVNKQISQSNN